MRDDPRLHQSNMRSAYERTLLFFFDSLITPLSQSRIQIEPEVVVSREARSPDTSPRVAHDSAQPSRRSHGAQVQPRLLPRSVRTPRVRSTRRYGLTLAHPTFRRWKDRSLATGFATFPVGPSRRARAIGRRTCAATAHARVLRGLHTYPFHECATRAFLRDSRRSSAAQRGTAVHMR